MDEWNNTLSQTVISDIWVFVVRLICLLLVYNGEKLLRLRHEPQMAKFTISEGEKIDDHFEQLTTMWT